MEVKRLFDIITNYLEKYPGKTDALAAKENEQWVTYDIKTFAENVNMVSYGLLLLGLKKGDKIATLSNNRPEWNFLDLGMLQLGCVHVPIYPTISETDLKFILTDAEIKMVVVSDELLWDKIQPSIQGLALKAVFMFNQIAGKPNWMDIVNAGRMQPQEALLNNIKQSIQPDDLATLLYTSGTIVTTHNLPY